MTQGSKPKVTQMGFILRFWLEHGHSKVFWRGSVEETGVDGPSRVHVQGGVGIVNFIRERLLLRGRVRLPRSSRRDGGR